MKDKLLIIILVGLNILLISLCFSLNHRIDLMRFRHSNILMEKEMFYEKRDKELINLNNNVINNFINFCLSSNNIRIQSNKSIYNILILIIPPSPCNDCVINELELLNRNIGFLSHFEKIFIIAPEEKFKDFKSKFFKHEKIQVIKYELNVFIESDYDSILYIVKNGNSIISSFLSNKRDVKLSEYYYNNIRSL